MRAWILLLALCAFFSPTTRAGAGPPLPTTPKHPVETPYWGVTVRDDYLWLEDWHDPAVRAWSDSQTAVTRDFLDHLPMRGAVLRQIESLTGKASPGWFDLHRAGGVFFALKDQPPKQQPLLVTLRSLADLKSEKVLVDPNVLDPSGSTTIDFFVPSRDGGKVAVSLSKGGTESGTVVRLGRQDRNASGRRGPPGERRHRRRQPRLEPRRERVLAHALPGARGAARGGPALLPAGLLPSPRHAARFGPLRPGEGVPEDRGDPAVVLRGREMGAGRRAQRGRRGPRAVADRAGRRRGPPALHLRGSRGGRGVRPGGPLPAVPQGCSEREGAAPAARRPVARAGRGHGPRGRCRHRVVHALRRPPLRRGDRGWTLAGARLHGPGSPTGHGAAPGAEHRGGDGADRRWRGRPADHPLHRTRPLDELRAGARHAGLDRARQPRPGELRRHRGAQRDRGLEGRHEGAAHDPPAERHEAGRHRADAALRLRRLRASASAPTSPSGGACGSTRAASMRSPTSAVAASSATPGTRPGT